MFLTTKAFSSFKILIFQVLDLPYERMPPRKDAPATPEDTSSGSALADGGNGEAPKANNSNG